MMDFSASPISARLRTVFTPAASSGVSGQQTKLMEFAGSRATNDPQLSQLLADAQLERVLKSQCMPPPSPGGPGEVAPMVAAFVVPIVAAIGQLAVNHYFIQQQRRIEQIIQGSTASYSLTADIDANRLAQIECLMLVRHSTHADGSPDKVGLQAVIKLESRAAGPSGTAALKFQPIFIRAENAVAQTLDGDRPTIAVSIGLSMKAVAAEQVGGVARLVPSGEGVVGVANIALGERSAAACVDSPCKASDLVPFPTNRGRLSLTMSVAEQGVTGFNDKAALADVAALKEALGPAIAAGIKAQLDD